MSDTTAAPLILIADDDGETRGIVRTSLQKAGYRTIEASDGDQALALIDEHRPQLVVLDVMMPGKSGWEVARDLRRDEALAGVGVLMLTGIGQGINALTSPLYGADAYLDKPFTLEALELRVREVLAGRKAACDAQSSSSSE
ncbi:MAG: response regulator [Proteobacteria bacterium]|nr:response regulator [Pseudomonadota bacterium]